VGKRQSGVVKRDIFTFVFVGKVPPASCTTAPQPFCGFNREVREGGVGGGGRTKARPLQLLLRSSLSSSGSIFLRLEKKKERKRSRPV